MPDSVDPFIAWRCLLPVSPLLHGCGSRPYPVLKQVLVSGPFFPVSLIGSGGGGAPGCEHLWGKGVRGPVQRVPRMQPSCRCPERVQRHILISMGVWEEQRVRSLHPLDHRGGGRPEEL